MEDPPDCPTCYAAMEQVHADLVCPKGHSDTALGLALATAGQAQQRLDALPVAPSAAGRPRGQD